MGDEPTVIDYRKPLTEQGGTGPRVLGMAFVLATALFCFLMFGSTHWVRLARPGGGMYGPGEQYVHDFQGLLAALYARSDVR